ncbi:MAG TPA: hypothetical protein VMR29_03155 [Candidatus Binatia bacterium]|nr:hypothetical protein [Candidatus Binatia bacterium]
MNMATGENDSFAAIAALAVWELVWAGIELLVVETRERLGNHLREQTLAAQRLPSDGEREAGELTIGRTRLRLELPLRCTPPGDDERYLQDTFGADTPLARIFVLRAATDTPARLEALLVADPVAGTWICTEPALGPASLRDLATLEIFFWSLIADRGDTFHETKSFTR